MKKYFLFTGLVVLAVSCQLQSGSDRNYAGKDNVYKLGLNPEVGSKYYYDISNESEIELEVDDKTTNSLSKTNVGAYYKTDKDSAGNFLFTITYDKIRIYSKSGDKETDMDAAYAENSTNPVERMLAVLKTANIKATITPAGEVKEVSGYKELSDKITAGFDVDDTHGKDMAKAQWEQLVEKGLIKKNMQQLFEIFPDSAIHVGGKWKLNSKQEGDFGMNVTTFYKLKAINEDIAIVESESEMVSDSSSTGLMGYNVTTNLTGSQQGEFEIEAKTGMLISSKIISRLKGTIQMMGREVPITIKTSMKMTGRR